MVFLVVDLDNQGTVLFGMSKEGVILLNLNGEKMRVFRINVVRSDLKFAKFRQILGRRAKVHIIICPLLENSIKHEEKGNFLLLHI